jgi:hypothetical protein
MAKKAVRELLLKAKDQGVRGVQKNVRGLGSDVNKMKLGWGAAGKAAAVAGTAMVVATTAASAGVVALGGSFIKTGAQVEEYRIKLRTVMRDQEKADKLFRDLIKFAATTPFELPGIIEAAIQLESFGHDAMELLPIIGDTAAAMTKDIHETAMAFTQGVTGEMEMLKQLTITGAQLNERVGKINRGTVEGMERAAEGITLLMRERFSGGMEDMAKAWKGTISMFSDQWFNFKKTMAEGGFFDTVKGDLQDVLKLVNRFSEEGGVDAIAVGFNNAFDLIHKTFFAPMIDDLDDLEINTVVVAATVEKAFLQVALTIQNVLDTASLTIKTFPALFKTIDPRFGVPGAFVPLLAESDAQVAKLAVMRARIDELNKALTDLRDPGKVFPLEALSPLETLGVESPGLTTKRTDAVKGAATTDAKTYAETFNKTLAKDFVGPTESIFTLGNIPEILGSMELLDAEAQDYHAARIDREIEYSEFYISTLEIGAERTREMYGHMLRYQEIFTRKGMNLGRAMNAMLIRGAGEVAKVSIAALTRKAKIEALSYAADALALLAQGNIAGAATMAAAAAKKGAIVGAGALAAGLIEREVVAREQALTERIDTMPWDQGGRGDVAGGARTRSRGSASTIRTGNQVNNFYIQISNNVAGDYNISEGELTDADQIQALFNEGLVQIPN